MKGMLNQIENKRNQISKILLTKFSIKESNALFLKINELVNLEIDCEMECNK